LIATSRSSCGSRALYTTPIPPRPIVLRTSYLPIVVGRSNKVLTSGLVIELGVPAVADKALLSYV